MWKKKKFAARFGFPWERKKTKVNVPIWQFILHIGRNNDRVWYYYCCCYFADFRCLIYAMHRRDFHCVLSRSDTRGQTNYNNLILYCCSTNTYECKQSSPCHVHNILYHLLSKQHEHWIKTNTRRRLSELRRNNTILYTKTIYDNVIDHEPVYARVCVFIDLKREISFIAHTYSGRTK